MGLSTVLKSLAGECRRHARWYRSAVHQHPVLASYSEPSGVLGALESSSGLTIEERSSIILALVRQQAAAPHAVWQAILLQAFAPMLLRLERAVRTCGLRDREQQILDSFLQAVVHVGARASPGCVAMDLRRQTIRPLFDRLRRDREERRCTRPLNPDRFVDPSTDRLEKSTVADDSTVPACAETLEYGGLRATVRAEHPNVSGRELERIYRRAQRGRHRLVKKLRSNVLRRAERKEKCRPESAAPTCMPEPPASRMPPAPSTARRSPTICARSSSTGRRPSSPSSALPNTSSATPPCSESPSRPIPSPSPGAPSESHPSRRVVPSLHQLPTQAPVGDARRGALLEPPAERRAPRRLVCGGPPSGLVRNGGDLMKWEDERYVKLYVRDTPEFLGMSWQARCLLHELLRKVDRAGTMKVGSYGVRGIAIALRAPVEEIEGPVGELVAQGRLVWKEAEGQYLIPNFVAAQNTRQSSAARKRRERERATGLLSARWTSANPTEGEAAAPPDSAEESRAVTRGHHESHAVTGGHTQSPDVPDSAATETSDAETPPDSAVRGNQSETFCAVTRSHAESRDVTIRSDQIRSEEIRSERSTYVCPPAGERDDEARVRAGTLRPIDRDAPLSAEGRAYAQTVGVTDVDSVYLEFVEYNVAAAKVAADWAAMWRLWCSRALKIQRRDRDRDRGRRRQGPMQMDEPGAVRGWTMPTIHHAKKKGEPQ
jgi:hypothetical protein